MMQGGFRHKMRARLFGADSASTAEPAKVEAIAEGVTATTGSDQHQDSFGDEVEIKRFDVADENNPQEPSTGISYTEVISLALKSPPSLLLSTFDPKIDLDDHYLRNVYNLSEEDDAEYMHENDADPMPSMYAASNLSKMNDSWKSASFRSNRGDAEPTSFGSTATDLDLTSTATDFAYENYRRGLTAVPESGCTIVPERARPMMNMIFGCTNLAPPPRVPPGAFAVPHSRQASCQAPYAVGHGQGQGLSPAQLSAQAANLDFQAAQLREAARQKDEAAMYARAQVSHSVDPLISFEAEAFAGNSDLSASKGTSRMWNKAEHGAIAEERTTLMLRNLPNDYTRDMLLELLDENGFQGRYNFIYLPRDFKRWAGLGYAFVNMISHEDGVELIEKLDGFIDWKKRSEKICAVTWGDQGQGLEAHIQRYRNSPVMHEEWPEEAKPLLLVDGKRVDFPPPTKKLRAPRMRR